MPTISVTPILRISKGNLEVFNNTITKGQFKTYLSASVASASGTITVDDISGISAGTGKYLLIGNFGYPDSEIVTVHTSTAPSGSTVTLNTNTTKAHTESDPVYVIDFNKISYEYAATVGGSKTVFGSTQYDINPTLQYSVYNDIAGTTGYGFARFYNSGATLYSSYSDSCPFTGYADGTVGKVIEETYSYLGVKDIDYDLGIEEVNSCLSDIESRKKRWTPVIEKNYMLAHLEYLVNSFTLPTDIRDNKSRDSIMSVRIADKAEPLRYVDYETYKYNTSDVFNNTLSTGASAGDTTVTLTSSYDFDESGTVYIEGQTTGITYTANAQSTGVLSGIPASGTGAITATLSAAANVWQNPDQSTPEYWTIDGEGNILIYPLISSDFLDKNIYIDYIKKTTRVDSLGDTLEIRRYDLVKLWLQWKIKNIVRNNSVASLEDPDYKLYEFGLQREMKMDKGDLVFGFKNARDFDNTFIDTRKWNN